MSDMGSKPVELKEDYKKLLENLSSKIAEKYYLLLIKKPVLEAEYQVKFGKKQYELFNVKMKSLKITKEVELLKAYYTHDEIKELLHKEFKEWEIHGKELLERYQASERYLKESKLCEDCDEIHGKLQALIRKSHPDIYTGVTDKIRKYWEQMDHESERANLNKARDLMDKIESMLKKHPVEEDLSKRVELLNRILENVKTQIDFIRSKYPFNIENELDNDDWLSSRKRDIEQEIGDMKDQIQFFSKKREEILQKRNM